MISKIDLIKVKILWIGWKSIPINAAANTSGSIFDSSKTELEADTIPFDEENNSAEAKQFELLDEDGNVKRTVEI